MDSTQDGSNLIFLFSQPRAGSTLLQRILGRHPDIHTLAEPWLMLPPFYALRPERCDAEYTSQGAWIGINNFLQNLPGKEEEYYEGVRRMYGYLYERALRAGNKRLFLDKTPRYFLIIDDLIRTFPEAKFLFLIRNPLAVLSSIHETWLSDNWLGFASHRIDLLDAPRLLTAGQTSLGMNRLTIHYESLVSDPQDEVRRLCGWLGVEYRPDMIEYGRNGVERWINGDPQGVYRHSRPTTDSIEKWLKSLKEPQVWRLARDYLEWLGPEQLQQMGYSYAELAAVVSAARPAAHRLWFTFSLAMVMKYGRSRWSPLLMGIQRVRNSIKRYGLTGAASRVLHKFLPLPFHRKKRANPEEIAIHSTAASSLKTFGDGLT
jgi:hypothetical protein